ncbi:glycosyltransferase [Methylobacter sp. YRD-M1]|uniref:glycosyltransferase n=1 Tax=Methylobacter sp. YRD-M1 TaxID=2911520 RepID=UPI00227AB73C|nr:glycosyltransferase [Methylobacter sp. YRD-M1]WAK00680.1 glycosyltransferase [Methylobacter sp. YRD-M1]
MEKTVTVPRKADKELNIVLGYQGRVEKMLNHAIVGWAHDQNQLMRPVQIDVLCGSEKITTLTADQDARSIGLDDIGACAFSLPLNASWLTGAKQELIFVYADTQKALTGSPFKIGPGRFDFKFTVEHGQRLIGWMQQRTLGEHAYSLTLMLDNEVLWRNDYHGGVRFDLCVDLPRKVFDNQPHTLQIILSDVDKKPCLITTRKIHHQYRGYIDYINFDKLTGWLVDTAYSEIPAVIDVVINGIKHATVTCHLCRPDASAKIASVTDRMGFEIVLPKDLVSATHSIEVFISGTNTRVISRKYILTPKDIIIRSLTYAAEQLKGASVDSDASGRSLSAGLSAPVEAHAWVRHHIIKPVIQQLRQSAGLPAALQLNPLHFVAEPCMDKSSIVDIIVPVYQGFDQTIDCINSVLAAQSNMSFELIVINDHSPDGQLTYKLRAMAKEHGFTLIENPKNLGFVATANIGLEQHKDRDVVLLNSDTLVFDHWLDRLDAASRQNSNIATVTPFSNNATICSFPIFNADNSIPDNIDPQQLDQWFAECNSGQIVDLPTAVGFCMWIKREALEETGYLDVKQWQQGYGEENDFCLRAATLGWRHVLAADVFVVHHGSISFAESKQQLLAENLPKLNKRYPDYPATVERFIQQDPVAILRNPVIKKLLRQRSDRYWLFVMHSLGGGAKTHGDHLAELLAQQGQPVLELSALTTTHWELRDQQGELRLIYRYPQDYPQLVSDLEELGVSRIHFHQIIGFPKDIWQLPKLLDCAFDFTAHDFLLICPRINMIDESGRYCENSQYDAAKCQRCIQLNGLPKVVGLDDLWQQHEQSMTRWRENTAQVLAQAEHIFCPSSSTADLYRKHFDLRNIVIRPHPMQPFVIQPGRMPADRKKAVNVAIIGAIGPHKGYSLILDCARHALKEGLPLHYVVIGFTCDDASLQQLDNVTITGSYENATQFAQLVEKHQCQLAAFLSVWPETFCYTLTEGLQNHLYPVALNYGALAERINALNYGMVIPANATAKTINQKLLLAAKKINSTSLSPLNHPGVDYPNLLNDYYQINEVD